MKHPSGLKHCIHYPFTNAKELVKEPIGNLRWKIKSA